MNYVHIDRKKRAYERKICFEVGVELGEQTSAERVDEENVEEQEQEVDVAYALVEFGLAIEADERGGKVNDVEKESKEEIHHNNGQQTYCARVSMPRKGN